MRVYWFNCSIFIAFLYCFIFLLSTPLILSKKIVKKSTKSPLNVVISDIHCDRWKIGSIIDIINNNGVGVIPTDTSYSFVTKISNREGTERIMELIGAKSLKKPLSLLVKDMSTISKYTTSLPNDQWVFKTLKATLPGSFTYILPSSKLVPKMVIESGNNKFKRRWKRKEIGIRMPADDITAEVLSGVDEPLLTGSIPQSGEDVYNIIHTLLTDGDYDDADSGFTGGVDSDLDTEFLDDELLKTSFSDNYCIQDETIPWYNQVDFIIDGGPRPLDMYHMKAENGHGLSTIVDLTSGKPIILRQGMGVHNFDE